MIIAWELLFIRCSHKLSVEGFGNGFECGYDGLYVLHSGSRLELHGVVFNHDFEVGFVDVVLATALQAVLPGWWGLNRIVNVPWSGTGSIVDEAMVPLSVGLWWSGG